MEKDEMNLVYKFLDVTGEKELVGMYFVLFVMGTFACLANYTNISLEISVPCALVIFISIVIMGDRIKEDGKFLFLYSGVEDSLLSLCFILIALGVSQLDLLHGCIVFTAMMLFSIPSNIYFAKREARKMLSGQGSRDGSKLAPLLGVAGSLGIIAGTIETKILSADMRNVLIMVFGCILFYISLGCAIRVFHKEIIRRRYNININNLLKQQAVKPNKRR